jgi:hypothetical protein
MKIYKHLTANAINLVPFDFLRELSMEAYLIENPMVLTLDNDGFEDVEILEDELTISSGRLCGVSSYVEIYIQQAIFIVFINIKLHIIF